ncbi:MAG: V4R domain-containing protein [Gemmataceae bacterium]
MTIAPAAAPKLEKPADKRLNLIWGKGPDQQQLSLIRTPRADQEGVNGTLRENLRIVTGQQPYKHNHYTDDQFFKHDAKSGILTNVYGQRCLRASEDFVVACLGGLEDELGDAAGEIMYKCGYEWGMEDMSTYSPRVQAEFEIAMNKMAMGLLLETWWWPLQVEGWGAWNFDLRQGKQGLIFIDLYESAVAQSLGNVGKVVCYFYAGMFAAVFSSLARRALSCIEIQCYSMGEDHCKFLIATEKRVNAASFWRQEGATFKDIMKKLNGAVTG